MLLVIVTQKLYRKQEVLQGMQKKQKCDRNISKVFASYDRWYHNGAKGTLERWFENEIWTD